MRIELDPLKSPVNCLICLLVLVNHGPAMAQHDESPIDFYQWFQTHTQSSLLYDKGSSLFVFSDFCPLFTSPNPSSNVITRLKAGTRVKSLSYPEENGGPIVYKGYNDYWYEVSSTDQNGDWVRGFVWGGDLAKGWSQLDLDQDGDSEWLLLGLKTNTSGTSPIQASLKLYDEGKTTTLRSPIDHCISEACKANVLVRMIQDPIWNGMQILEVSTIQLGCDSETQRSFYYWTGKGFKQVYRTKWSDHKTEKAHSFVYTTKRAGDSKEQSYHCRYSYMGKKQTPVWRCIPITKETRSTTLPSESFSAKPSRAR